MIDMMATSSPSFLALCTIFGGIEIVSPGPIGKSSSPIECTMRPLRTWRISSQLGWEWRKFFVSDFEDSTAEGHCGAVAHLAIGVPDQLAPVEFLDGLRQRLEGQFPWLIVLSRFAVSQFGQESILSGSRIGLLALPCAHLTIDGGRCHGLGVRDQKRQKPGE